eukprot:jgi/Bigna1/79571/fgenesh1_pg.63_\
MMDSCLEAGVASSFLRDDDNWLLTNVEDIIPPVCEQNGDSSMNSSWISCEDGVCSKSVGFADANSPCPLLKTRDESEKGSSLGHLRKCSEIGLLVNEQPLAETTSVDESPEREKKKINGASAAGSNFNATCNTAPSLPKTPVRSNQKLLKTLLTKTSNNSLPPTHESAIQNLQKKRYRDLASPTLGKTGRNHNVCQGPSEESCRFPVSKDNTSVTESPVLEAWTHSSSPQTFKSTTLGLPVIGPTMLTFDPCASSVHTRFTQQHANGNVTNIQFQKMQRMRRRSGELRMSPIRSAKSYSLLAFMKDEVLKEKILQLQQATLLIDQLTRSYLHIGTVCTSTKPYFAPIIAAEIPYDVVKKSTSAIIKEKLIQNSCGNGYLAVESEIKQNFNFARTNKVLNIYNREMKFNISLPSSCVKPEKKYRCLYCKKEFKQKSNIEAHVRVHTGSRPFNCSVCNKAFSQKSNLNRHFESSSHMKNEKRYSADQKQTSISKY